MIDELYEYANLPPSNGIAGPASPPPTTLAPLQQLFPWLPTLPPAPSPLSPPSPSLPPSTVPIAGDATEQSSDVVKDILDANHLMRAFLKTMSRDGKKVYHFSLAISSFFIV